MTSHINCHSVPTQRRSSASFGKTPYNAKGLSQGSYRHYKYSNISLKHILQTISLKLCPTIVLTICMLNTPCWTIIVRFCMGTNMLVAADPALGHPACPPTVISVPSLRQTASYRGYSKFSSSDYGSWELRVSYGVICEIKLWTTIQQTHQPIQCLALTGTFA